MEKDQDRYGRKAYTEVEAEEYRVTANMVIPWLFGCFAVSNPATFGLEYQLMPESRPDSNTGAGRRSTLRHTLDMDSCQSFWSGSTRKYQSSCWKRAGVSLPCFFPVLPMDHLTLFQRHGTN